jgi:hypothetical protein
MTMKACPVCGGRITKEDPYFIFHSNKTDADEFCCSKCEQVLINIMESDDPEIIEKAKIYLNTYVNKVEEAEVKSFIKDVLESSPSSIRNKHYTEGTDSFWISGLKAFTWISFFIIIIIGFTIGIPYFSYQIGIGIAIILATFIVAFLSAAGIMVFLGMVENIEIIKKRLEK